jgi:hypothetical protein
MARRVPTTVPAGEFSGIAPGSSKMSVGAEFSSLLTVKRKSVATLRSVSSVTTTRISVLPACPASGVMCISQFSPSCSNLMLSLVTRRSLVVVAVSVRVSAV